MPFLCSASPVRPHCDPACRHKIICQALSARFVSHFCPRNINICQIAQHRRDLQGGESPERCQRKLVWRNRRYFLIFLNLMWRNSLCPFVRLVIYDVHIFANFILYLTLQSRLSVTSRPESCQELTIVVVDFATGSKRILVSIVEYCTPDNFRINMARSCSHYLVALSGQLAFSESSAWSRSFRTTLVRIA